MNTRNGSVTWLPPSAVDQLSQVGEADINVAPQGVDRHGHRSPLVPLYRVAGPHCFHEVIQASV